MLMEDDRDDEEWAEDEEDNKNFAIDPVSTASSSLQRFAKDMGEKTTLAAIGPIIAELRKPDASNAQKRANYTVIGLIAETCEASFKANLMEQMMTLSVGIQSTNVRVKFAALQALAELMDVLAPKV